MFSTFGQATQNPSPALNPFAAKANPFVPKSNPFAARGADPPSSSEQKGRGAQSENESRRKNANRHKSNETHLSDGGMPKNKRGDDRNKKNHENGTLRLNNTRPRNPTPKNHVEAVTTDTFGNGLDDATTGTVPVYTQLRKDGIHPPSWPSQPGNPNNKATMAKFRECYEQYREKARASLVKSGLIDDPSKRKTLSDAIDFKGICEDMCPEYEKITRITELDVHQPEKDPETGYAVNALMVKKLARSAAGQEAPLPMDVRSVPTLRRTLDYLIDDILQNDDNLPGLHGFLWDRTRAIRRDFTFFSSLAPEELQTQVYVLENITRFHVTSLHLLSQEGNRPEDFVEQQELEQLGKALLSLRDLYDDCNDQGIECNNEAEFRAYYLIFHGSDPNIIDTLQRQWRPSLWKDSDEVRTAVSLVEALQNTKDFHGPLKEAPSLAASAAYNAYFRIVEDSSISYTMACFAECHFARLRRSILSSITRALARPKNAAKDVTAAELNRYLRFDTVDQAVAFAELHHQSFQHDEDHPTDLARQRLILCMGKRLPHHRLQHQFSSTLVEKKRGLHSLPDVIHKTIFEDGKATKEMLFKEDQRLPSHQATPKGTQVSEPSIRSGHTPGIFGKNKINGDSAAANLFKLPSQPSVSTQLPPTSALLTPSSQVPGLVQKPAVNPFASVSKPDATSLPISALGTNATSQKQPSPTEHNGSSGSVATTQTNTSLFPTNPFANHNGKISDESDYRVVQPFEPNPFISPNPRGHSLKPFVAAGNVSSQVSVSGAQDFGGLPNSKAPTIGFPSPESREATQASGYNGVAFPQIMQGNNLGGGSLDATLTTTQTSISQSEQQRSSNAEPTSETHTQQTISSLPHTSFRTTTPSLSPPLIPAQPVRNPTSTKPPVLPHASPSPSCDPIGNFTRWFVLGDNGLLDEFRDFIADSILSRIYDEFVQQQREEIRKEEEESLAAEAEDFRIYNTRLKYFYLWKKNARLKRMRFLRFQAREKQRQYYQAQREADSKLGKASLQRKAEQHAQLSLVDRRAELSTMLTSRKRSRSEAEDALTASGMPNGMTGERQFAKRIISRDYTPISDRPSTSNSARESTTSRNSNGKTAALREKFFGDKSVGFRKSLPPMSSSLESSVSRSRVSDRWRLKAMGIVKLPDGTAVPESLANDIMLRGKSFPGWGLGRTSTPTSRRGSFAGDVRPTVELSAIHTQAFDNALLLKRKRLVEDDGSVTKDDASKPQKRIMSEGGEELGETYQLIAEMRAMREELEEGTQWFREQNDRLESGETTTLE